MIFIKEIYSIFNKDLIIEFRTKELFSSMFIFALLVIIIFNFAFDLSGSVNPAQLAHGILWVAFTFSGILGLNRSFLSESENDCMQGLLLSPIDRSAIYLGKMLSNLVFMSVMELMIMPFFVIFFNIDILTRIYPLFLIIFLGTLGFIAVGTLFSAMSANIKTREIMLPVLLFPVVVPIIIASVKSTGAVMANKPLSSIAHWIQLLVIFDAVFIASSVAAFEYVIEE